MARRAIGLFLFLVMAPALAASAEPQAGPAATGLADATAVTVSLDGRVYVARSGAVGKDGDGVVQLVEKERALPFAAKLDDPTGIAVYLEWLFVADRQRIWRMDRKGTASVYAPAAAFPAPPRQLQDLVADPESGTLYASDAGDRNGKGGAVYRISPKGRVDLVADARTWPGLHTPHALALDGASHLLLADAGTGALHRIKLADRSHEQLATGLSGTSLAWDRFGRLFAGAADGQVLVIPRPGAKPVPMATGCQEVTDLHLAPDNRSLLVLDRKARVLRTIPGRVPGHEVLDTPLPLEPAVAFSRLAWTGWKLEDEAGRVAPLRPIVLTHAGDGSNRVFVATQHGVIHVFPNDPEATQTTVFLDIRERVRYDDKQNEEGFLGLAFHPQFKKNGEFFVFYTRRQEKMTNVVSRFRVRRDDPNRADPASEEQVLRIENRPFWNHDGGTVCFGPDGYLYVAVGDGGAANDPFDNGQKLTTLFGKVLRIDVDRKDPGKRYAVPPDNPFAGRTDARPEIWAYGLRNVWRMAFDRATGTLWAGDVGQNLYEEIDLLQRGGNYGWNRREGLHPFGPRGQGPRADFVEPIWEYHHDIGKSITGGLVYRGKRLPELEGAYLYADYVSGKIWALRYDAAQKRVVANQPLRDRGTPILSFGEDEQGEVYFLTVTPSGQGIHQFVRAKPDRTR